jgi:ribonuclease T2
VVQGHPALRRAALAALLLVTLAAPASARDQNVPGDFDFYVLSLSWTPTYCATAQRPDPDECGQTHNFTVHGLWPQYDYGAPESCYSGNAPWVNRSTLEGISDLMPDRGLAIYEWRTHGTCAGLRPDRYFALLRQAFGAVKIPPALIAPQEEMSLAPNAIEASFISANPSLPSRAIAVECDGGRLTEVRICFDKNLAFRRCATIDGSACRAGLIKVPPVK